MTIPINTDLHNPLLEVANRYKIELKEPESFMAEFVHYHDKNPDANLQIKLLEEASSYINSKIDPENRPIAQLGILLIFRDLLIDPNRQGDVYSYLIEELELDATINKVLKEVSPRTKFDLADEKFMKINKQAINIGQTILESEQIKASISKDFLEDVKKIIFTENNYADKIIYTLEISRKP